MATTEHVAVIPVSSHDRVDRATQAYARLDGIREGATEAAICELHRRIKGAADHVIKQDVHLFLGTKKGLHRSFIKIGVD